MDGALDLGTAAMYSRDPDGNLRITRTEQSVGERKGLKVVPMQGSVIAERFGGAEVSLYTEGTSNARAVTDLAYAEQLADSLYYEAFCGFGMTVEVKIRAQVTYPNTLYIRIKDEDGNVVGAEQNTTSASYELLTFSWEEINCVGDTLSIEAYVSGGQGIFYVESIKLKNPFARPVVEANGSSAAAALTVELDTKGFPFVSIMYDADSAGVIKFQVSRDGNTWKTHTQYTPSSAGEVICADFTVGFRYVRLSSASAITMVFWLSAKH